MDQYDKELRKVITLTFCDIHKNNIVKKNSTNHVYYQQEQLPTNAAKITNMIKNITDKFKKYVNCFMLSITINIVKVKVRSYTNNGAGNNLQTSRGWQEPETASQDLIANTRL